MYDNPIYQTYTLAASAIDTAGTKLSVVGPAGTKGRLVSIGSVVVNDVTVAASTVNVGITGTLAKYGTLSVPISSAAAVANAATISTSDSNEMPADTAVLISAGGEATAGDADLTVTIAWY